MYYISDRCVAGSASWDDLQTKDTELRIVVDDIRKHKHQLQQERNELDRINSEVQAIQSQISLAGRNIKEMQDTMNKLRGKLSTQSVRTIGAVRLLGHPTFGQFS